MALLAQRPNEAWPASLAAVPFKPVPVSETPDVSYIKNHHTILPHEREALGLKHETWKAYREIWAAYRPELPGSFLPVVYRVLDENNSMRSFLFIYDTSMSVVGKKEIMHQDDGEGTRQSHLYKYSVRINDRVKHRGKSGEWLIGEEGKLEEFNYYHRSVEKARESLTQAWVRPLAGAVLYNADGSLYDTLPFASSLRVIRHSNLAPFAKDNDEYYTVVLDYGRFLRNAQLPRQGDSLAYIRKSEVVPPVAYHTDYSGKTYAGPDTHYSRMVSYSMNFEPFLEIDSTGLNQSEVRETERVEQTRYQLGEKKSWSLTFADGSERIFKDSTYQSEYSPTSYYRLFENPAIPDDHLIYAPFFEDSYFYLLSGQDGDTVYKFADYPFYSPNKKLVVSMSVPYTYDDQEATLELVMLKDGKYTEPIQLTFVNWNFSDDREIYWLSDEQFIIKATAPHKFHENEPDYFYLRFRLKPQYFK